MDLFSAMGLVASGLTAQRTRLNTVASNLANIETTRTADGGPYRRIDPVFEARSVAESFAGLLDDELAGEVKAVQVVEIREDPGPPRWVYDPDHPDADPDGYVGLPNVNLMEEMVNLVTCQRSYEATATVMTAIKAMARVALDL